MTFEGDQSESMRELNKIKVLFVKANSDVENVQLDNRAIFEKFFWDVWEILGIKDKESDTE